MENFKRLILVFVFLGALVNLKAQDRDTHVSNANSMYAAGKFVEAAMEMEKALTFPEAKLDDYYNTACYFAASGDKDKAFDYLIKTVDKGWYDFEQFAEDKDLMVLNTDPRWNGLKNYVELKVAELESKLPTKHDDSNPIMLPKPKTDGKMSLEQALQNRRSKRNYSEKDMLTLEQVSQLLWAAYGVTDSIKGRNIQLKTAASAGGRYPLEVYLVAGNVKGLAPGIYKFIPKGHKLIKIVDGDKRKELCANALDQKMVEFAPISIVYSAVYSRTTSKYADRGKERYVCMDLGHSGQNVYLQATALKLGTCAIGAFIDIKVKMLVNMTREETPLYIMPVGNPVNINKK